MKKLSSFLHPSIVDCESRSSKQSQRKFRFSLRRKAAPWKSWRFDGSRFVTQNGRTRKWCIELETTFASRSTSWIIIDKSSTNENRTKFHDGLQLFSFSNFLLGFRRIRFPPFAAPPELSNPRTHLVWLKTDAEPVRSVFVVVTDGNLKILNEILVDFNNGENQRSLLLSFLHRNILVNRTSPICGQRVHVDRSRIERCAPEFLSCCHYRSIDIDVLDVLSQQWAPNVFQHRP